MTVIELFFLVSVTVGDSYSMVQPIFGSLSLILDLRFSTMFKCSAYLSKIASLSGRRVLGNGVAPELFEGVNIGFLSTRFPYALSVYERLIFFCFLSQPGVLQVIYTALPYTEFPL